MDHNEKEATQSALLRDVEQILPSEFQLLSYVGEGGHGIVFKAFHKLLHTNVALKLIKNDGSAGTEKQLERMQNEARTLAKLNHANIVKVLQFTQCKDGTPLLICEFVEGRTLASFIQKSKQLNKDQLMMVFTQLLDALRYSHEHEMIHRDIKPNNIMIVTDNESKAVSVKLLDFGIARDFEQSVQTPLGLTRTIQITGSAPYMSPEQCAGNRVDARSDLYSVGCVLFECLSGRPPFTGETPVHTRYMQIHEAAKMPSVNTDADLRSKAELYKLALKALAKSPDERIQSADSFKEEFIRACSAARFETSTGRSSQKMAFLNGALIGATSIALIALLGVISWNPTHKQQNPEQGAILAKPVSKSTNKRGLSVLHDLVEVFKSSERMNTYTPGSIEYQRRSLEAWDLINNAIPKIPKNDNSLLFAGWWLRFEIAQHLHQTDEMRKSAETALKYCVSQDGKETVEAAQCYAALAKCSLKTYVQGDSAALLRAQDYASRAVELRQELERGKYVSLPLHDSLGVSDQSGGIWDPLGSLVAIEELRGNTQKALQYALKAADSKSKQEAAPAMTDDICTIGELYWKLNKKKEAFAVIEKQNQALLNSKEPVDFKEYARLFNWANARELDFLHGLLKASFTQFQKAGIRGDIAEYPRWKSYYEQSRTLYETK